MSDTGKGMGSGNAPGSLAVLEAKRAERKEASEEKKALFIQALAVVWPNVAEACKSAGIGRSQVYAERQKDEKFRQKWDEIVERNMDDIENHILKAGKERGGAGYLFPLLKAYRRHVYGDRIEHSGSIASVSLTVAPGLGTPPAETPATVGEGGRKSIHPSQYETETPT